MPSSRNLSRSAARLDSLLNWRPSIEGLMRSLEVVVLCKMYQAFTNASVTAHPRIMKPVDPHFGRVKLFFDEVSLNVFTPNAQS
mgnify:CR=1 FL=1